MSELVACKLTVRNDLGKLIRVPAVLEYRDGRIWFVESPYALKDEIKAMAGSKWHGFDDEPVKMWSISDCQRNRFQLAFLMGENVYQWFDRDIVRHEYYAELNGVETPLMEHQKDLADSGLTYHYQLWAAEMGTGKTLAAQKVIEMGEADLWYWVGPKSSLPNIKREFHRWGFDFQGPKHVEFMTYEGLKKKIEEWTDEDVVPEGVIFDESSRLKGYDTQRSKAAQALADEIREVHGQTGYVIEMSGTPSPKSPLDWWKQCEIAWPGFLREGSRKALEQRLSFMAMKEYAAGVFQSRVGWKDDERKCDVCGETVEDGAHIEGNDGYHEFVPSRNEISYMYERLKGLVVIKHKKDCLSLPEKRYRRILCRPNPSTLRVADAIVKTAPNTITGLTLLRELSDGFQYREIENGEMPCKHCPESCGQVDEWYDPEDEEATYSAIDMLSEELTSRLVKRTADCPCCGGSGKIPTYERVAKQVPCPKDKALKLLLDECEETGRIVIFAGFTGSVDRVVELCHSEKWCVVRCDGRGFEVTDHDGEVITQVGEHALDYWSDKENQRVAFVAHPESGGMSLTLTEARMAVYWSNSFKPEFRVQSEDRIHRKGMDENLGCEIVDLIHLPTDSRVLEVIQANRKLELMTLGEFRNRLEDVENEADLVVEEVAA